jgi:hypothetical protein
MKACPSLRIHNLIVVRETQRYPVISGEIVKIKGECFLSGSGPAPRRFGGTVGLRGPRPRQGGRGGCAPGASRERWACAAHTRGKDLRGCAPGASRERWACAAHTRGKGADGASAPRGPLASPGSPHGVKRGFHTRRQDPP